MYFAFSQEQEEFRDSLRRLLTKRAPMTRVRAVAAADDGYDAETWRLLCRDMGLPGLHIGEEYGGGGFSYLETAVALQELGRALTPVPMAATAFACEAVLRLGTPEQRRRLLPPLARGERLGAFAVAGRRDLEPEAATVRAEAAPGAGAVLHGTRDIVLHGDPADLLIVPAVAEAGGPVRLYAVEAGDPRVTAERQESLDLTRPVARVAFDGAPAEPLGGAEAPAGALDRVIDTARTLLAFEMLGTAERCLEMAVDYAKVRHQFNRPIGSFQAIKHRCADMAVELDMAYGAAMYAAMLAGDDTADIGEPALIAKAQAAEALRLCAGGSIQVHGGIGFTWEHDAHLYFRRAKAVEALFGSIHEHRALLADRIAI
ncbi:acyl-CoA/acyl-ACP dehydrogenase [Yinghuangia sp. ASG 101]|uniref:acyl-CoA dehydrogenase family protein n=1 Tax=Yinghuangia sp. ASG 101 TaxID=2896848 RepID=UPI001E49512A|nr:acyl-CoA dehydrogenase family protein [Yinghuangia sp. ASG 101]UGQ11607.1 acyl-CoA/acyl-ACP dehydrogenase [Yinghuangia sp. ASG 101]